MTVLVYHFSKTYETDQDLRRLKFIEFGAELSDFVNSTRVNYCSWHEAKLEDLTFTVTKFYEIGDRDVEIQFRKLFPPDETQPGKWYGDWDIGEPQA
jgi:hypothetical protein